MGDGKWFRRGRRRTSGGNHAGGKLARGAAKRAGSLLGKPLRHSMSLEALEDRRMLAVFTVTNLQDTQIVDGEREVVAGSLRAAVDAANGNDFDEADFIVFADGLTGTIGLNFGQLTITQPVSIIGPNPTKLGVSAAANARIFETNIRGDDETYPVQISGLTLQNGNMVAGDVEQRRGGAIFNREDLRMVEVILQNNNAQNGGGAIFQAFGSLSMDRSLVLGNSAGGLGGGAILVGTDGDDPETRPNALIQNTSFALNSTGGNGGAIYNRGGGDVTISQSTIINNTASFGAGVASWGNPAAEDPMDDPPPPVIFTNIYSSIIANNIPTAEEPDEVRMLPAGDLDEIGATEGDDMNPARPLEQSIFSLDFNIIGVTNVLMLGADQIGVDPMLEQTMAGGPIDRGGSTPVFLPIEGSPAIDMGDPDVQGGVEQRGRHFARVFGDAMDVGATEKQNGLFVVDVLLDESDVQYSDVAIGGDPYTFGDFSLREALEFSRKNTEIDTIQFSTALQTAVDPTISPAPTILLTQGAVDVDSTVFIEGPTTWLLEIDASGNDPTPLVNNSDGSRVFNIDNGAAGDFLDVSISDLTIMGADQVGSGGGIFSHENLALARLTVKENNVSNDGGAVYIRYGTLAIENLTVNNNRAAGTGGGVFIAAPAADAAVPAVTIVGSTFSGNTAGFRGAGIANNGGQLTIEYSTITANSAGGLRASGIYNLALNTGSHLPMTSIRSSIVSGNANSDIEHSNANGATLATFVSLGYNLVGNGIAAAAFTATGDTINILNPMLDPLAITGGLLATHRPKTGSPVIDRGDPAAVAGQGGVPEFDQRGPGFSRIYDGDNDSVDRIDIGSYELQPNMIVVDNAADIDDGDLSQGNVSLREAINLSNINPIPDVIVFDITMLPPSITVGMTTLAIVDSVTIMGPGSGVLAIVSNVPNRLFNIDNAAPTLINVTMSGLEVRNGTGGAMLSRENIDLDDMTFLNNSASTSGGAIFHETGSFKLKNSLVTGNFTNAAAAHGGGLYLRNAQVEIVYTIISGNSVKQTGSHGGAISAKNVAMTVSQGTISGNTTTGGADDGGGVFIDGSTVLFEESTISANSTIGANSRGAGLAIVGANSSVTLDKNTILAANTTIGSASPGGGAYVAAGVLNINNSTVSQNFTLGINSPGGGLAIVGGAVNVTGSTVTQNEVRGTGGHGGGIYAVDANLLVRNSTVVDNRATPANARGGGIYSNTNLTGTQKSTILNSTISGNTAAFRGGGVFNADGRIDIKHSTITNNSTPYFNAGSGVGSAGNVNTLTTVASSIIAGNVGAISGIGSDVDIVEAPFVNSFQSLGYNVVGIGNALGTFIQTGDKTGITDPKLGLLDLNGGTTMTHALLAGSPAINAGSPAFNPNAFSPALTTDQRGVGFPRAQGGRIDAGAYESNFSAFSADFDTDGDVDGSDFLRWQRGLGKPNPTKLDGDANGDGTVNGVDLGSWKSQFGSVGSEAAIVPAAVSGGSETPPPAPLAVQAPAAEESAPTDFSPLATPGTPAGTATSRTSYRPPVERREAVAASRSAAFAVWAPAAVGSDDNATPLQFDADEAGDPDLSGEDAVFALLGDGAL